MKGVIKVPFIKFRKKHVSSRGAALFTVKSIYTAPLSLRTYLHLLFFYLSI